MCPETLPHSPTSAYALPMPPTDVDKLLAAMNEGSNRARCDAIRALCPCRNNRVRDLEVWAEIFRKAREGRPARTRTKRRMPSAP